MHAHLSDRNETGYSKITQVEVGSSVSPLIDFLNEVRMIYGPKPMGILGQFPSSVNLKFKNL
jgi:hypothetical protein